MARFFQEGHYIDYITDVDIVGGTVVVIGDLIGVVDVDVLAGQLASMHVDGVYEVEKTSHASTGIAFTMGKPVFWDTTNKVAVAATGAGIVPMGICTQAATKTDNSVFVRLG